MKTQVSARGMELTDGLRSRAEDVARALGDRQPELAMTKFMLEERANRMSIGVVLAFQNGATIVRHAEAPDWDRAFLELDRKLERALAADAG